MQTKKHLPILIVVCLGLALGACGPAAVETQTPPPASASPTSAAPVETGTATATPAPAPVLRSDLARNCQPGGRGDPGPRVGEAAIEFTLLDVHGTAYTLSELLSEKPVVLVFGSFT